MKIMFCQIAVSMQSEGAFLWLGSKSVDKNSKKLLFFRNGFVLRDKNLFIVNW